MIDLWALFGNSVRDLRPSSCPDTTETHSSTPFPIDELVDILLIRALLQVSDGVAVSHRMVRDPVIHWPVGVQTVLHRPESCATTVRPYCYRTLERSRIVSVSVLSTSWSRESKSDGNLQRSLLERRVRTHSDSRATTIDGPLHTATQIRILHHCH